MATVKRRKLLKRRAVCRTLDVPAKLIVTKHSTYAEFERACRKMAREYARAVRQARKQRRGIVLAEGHRVRRD